MLIGALLAVLFFLPRQVFAVVVAGIALLAGHEWARLCGLRGPWFYAFIITALCAVCYLAGDEVRRAVFVAGAAFWIALVPWWLAHGVPRPGMLALAGIAVLVPAALAMALLPPRELLAVLVLIWIADSAAYFVGRAFGRRRLAPAISPGKTWEGAAGGMAGALAWAIILAILTEGATWMAMVAAAVLLVVLSIVGDLFESAVKRKAGVKDSGTLLPGHGGVLDRIDSAAATLPVAALLLSFRA